MFYGWKPYVPVAERRRQAEREAAKIRKKGGNLTPVVLTGNVIARTFWGKAWCENLERYSDYDHVHQHHRVSYVDLDASDGRGAQHEALLYHYERNGHRLLNVDPVNNWSRNGNLRPC